ncbi:MAG: hypothetical protein J0M26_06940 [Planctomycetes bacterium]|nr:hypothetical protein [Planctomycetota bacterium]
MTSGPFQYIRHRYDTATAGIVTGLALLLASLNIIFLRVFLLVYLRIRSHPGRTRTLDIIR